MPPEPDAPFLRACRGLPASHTPVWFMRQAGRHLPEYKAKKGTVNILQAIQQPELACEITLQPVRRYGMDAAILYSDIMVPAFAIGFGVDIQAGVGPVVAEPFTSEADLTRLRPLDPEGDTGYVLETVRLLTAELDVPLIGFAGAPFTVASYLVEGQPTRDYLKIKSLMWHRPELFRALLDRLADLALASLRSQVEAGAAAVQVFDSWAGALDRVDYETHVLPSLRRIFDGVADLGVPRIASGVGTAGILDLLADAGADVVSVDSSLTLAQARELTAGRVALQGNLDPALLALAPWPLVEERTLAVLAANGGHPGHVFNVGHGLRPETNPEHVARVVDLVHERTASALNDG